MEFKGTKGKRALVNRQDWIDVVSNGERITSFDKSDEKSIYDALLDAKAPEMLEMLKIYLADLNNIFPKSDAQRSRIYDVEQLIKEATEL